MAKIDIIIPAYNAKATIQRALASIACQTLVDDIKTTIINDGGESYHDIVRRFKSLMEIDEYDLETNKGVAYARQYGINKTQAPHLMFLDSDDELAGMYSVEFLYRHIVKKPETEMVIGRFLQRKGEDDFVEHNINDIRLHGKLYSRKALKRNGIQFLTKRYYNEDLGFTVQCNSLLKAVESDMNIVYFWDDTNKDSITRKNGDISYTTGFDGYTHNLRYAISKILSTDEKEETKKAIAVKYLMGHWLFYITSLTKAPEESERILQYCKEYYKEIFKQYDKQDIYLFLTLSHDTEIGQAYKTGFFKGVIPEITFFDFMKEIRG